MLYRLLGYKKTTLFTLAEDFPKIKDWKEFTLIEEQDGQTTEYNAFASLKGMVFHSHTEFLKEVENNLNKTFKKHVKGFKGIKENRPERHTNFTPEQTHKEYLEDFHTHLRRIEKDKKMQKSLLGSIWLGKLKNGLLTIKTTYSTHKFDEKIHDWIPDKEHKILLKIKGM